MASTIDPSLLGEPISVLQPCHPLHREGAVIILSPEEQLLQDAMLMSSSPPAELLLGKRTRNEDGDDEGEHILTSPAPQPKTLLPSTSNITVVALQYATTKKLHPEQWDEAEAFLLVSCYFIAHFTVKSLQESAVGQRARLYITILSIENKIDTFRLAVPPYQVSDELKVCDH